MKETQLQAKKRQVQADKLKKEVETAAIMKERQLERLKQEEEFKMKKKLAGKSEIKVEILVSQPPTRPKTNE